MSTSNDLADPQDWVEPHETNGVGHPPAGDHHLGGGNSHGPDVSSLSQVQDFLDSLDEDSIRRLREPWVSLRSISAMRDDAEGVRQRAVSRLGLKGSRRTRTFKVQQGAYVTPEQIDTFMPMLRQAQDTESAFAERQLAMMKEIVPEEFYDWVGSTEGLGYDSMARLLGATKHPLIAFPAYHLDDDGKQGEAVYTDPFVRTLPQLRQFCGHGGPSRRRKGMTQDELFSLGQPEAKKRLYLIEEAVFKGKGPYRERYLMHHAATEGKVHTTECPPCKGSSQVGDPWRPAHRMAHAKRMVGKDILADIYDIFARNTTVESLEAML
jgi:hypothetical protein